MRGGGGVSGGEYSYSRCSGLSDRERSAGSRTVDRANAREQEVRRPRRTDELERNREPVLGMEL